MPPQIHSPAQWGSRLSAWRSHRPVLTSSPRLFTPSSSQSFSQTARQCANKKKRKVIQNPYLRAQARQRKIANTNRQAELQKAREVALGNPVLSNPTPFLQSLKDPVPYSVEPFLKSSVSSDASLEDASSSADPPAPLMNHFLTPSEIDASLRYSNNLIEPFTRTNQIGVDIVEEEKIANEHKRDHANAAEAINRIVGLENASAADKTRANVHRIIETFGRHNTDGFLKPKGGSDVTTMQAEKTPRVGRDTGSSEVQIALLTAQILKLVEHLSKRTAEGRKVNNKDQHSRRSLRLLVHKRQKHLKYLRKKERGGERWQHAVKMLGITDAAWKGEITV